MSEETVLKAEIGKKGVKPQLPLILIAAGLVLLVVNVFHVDVMGFLWPGFIVGTGLLMLLPAYKSTEEDRSSLSFFAIPGAMIVANGALLFLMNMFYHFESMAYAWTLRRAVFCKYLTKEYLEAEMFGRPQYKVVNLYS